MPIFIVTSQHTAESCPIQNEKERKFYLEAFAKMGEFTKSHGIKILGSYAVIPVHKTYMILEVPSADAMQKAMADPLMLQTLARNMSTIEPVMTMEESMKMLQGLK
jgi:hypothetical protein